MAFGIGHFIYELELNKDGATYKFMDPEDPSTTASASISSKDIGEDVALDSRQAADFAFSEVSDQLNKARDARIAKEEQDDLAAKQADEQQARERAADFFNNTEHVAVAPHHIEKDGTTVYTVPNASTPPAEPTKPSEEAPASDDTKKKK